MDGLRAYLPAVEDVFGADIDFAQMVKLFGKALRMDIRRFTSLTNVGGGAGSRSPDRGDHTGSGGRSRRVRSNI